MNEVQVIGTHNSYKRETTPAEQAKYDELIRTPGDYAQYLAYSHPTITNQLKRQHVRGLELDLWPDPQGGLYANPFVRQALDLGPLPNAEWTQARDEAHPRRRPRLQHDRGCIRFVSCLEQIKAWSAQNPRHLPLLIMLEFKQSDPRVVAGGGVKAPPWDATNLETRRGRDPLGLPRPRPDHRRRHPPPRPHARAVGAARRLAGRSTTRAARSCS